LLDECVRQDVIAKKLRIWGNTDGFFAQLRQMTLKQIGDSIQQLAEIDYAIKTGRTTPEGIVGRPVHRLPGVSGFTPAVLLLAAACPVGLVGPSKSSGFHPH